MHTNLFRRSTMGSILGLARETASFAKLKKSDQTVVQAAVNECVREGCSVERMQLVLKRAGFDDKMIAALVDEAYPPAAPAPGN